MNDATQVIEAYKSFRSKKWMPGGQGALASLCSINDNSSKVYVTPDQIRDDLSNSDLFLLRNLYGSNEMQAPLNSFDETLTISRWTPIFLEIIARFPKTRAIAQLCTKWSVLAARMSLEAWKKKADQHPNVLRLSHWELLNHLGASNELLIPVVSLSSGDTLLAETKNSLSLYPNTCAILIRDYGIVVWGESFSDLERRVEILEHVCELQTISFTLFP